VLPQKLQTSGVRKATSDQWWQTDRKFRDLLSNPSKSALESDVPLEDMAKDLWWKLEDV